MACISQVLCSRTRFVSYLPGIHVLVHSVAGTRASSAAVSSGSGEPTMTAAFSHMGLRGGRPDESTRPSWPLDQSLHLPGVEEQRRSLAERVAPDVLSPSSSSEKHEVSDRGDPTPSHSRGTAEPYFDTSRVECAIQSCPELLKKDLQSMFPEAPLSGMMVVTVTQRTQNDMMSWRAEVEQEREHMLDKFVHGAEDICIALQKEGFWADFIDPSSGLAFFGVYTNNTLFETDDRYRHLGFQIEDLGCCRVIRHSLWGTHAFVGTIFTNAPPSTLMKKLQSSSTPAQGR
ncbi:metabolism of cobalamin associated Db isoform 2-T3 [Odontesthes bonariensis]